MIKKHYFLCILSVVTLFFGCQSGKKISIIKNDLLGEFVLIEAGYFTKGYTKDQQEPCLFCGDTVELRMNSFYLGKTEVTQAQWQIVMGENPSSHICPNCPVENISYGQVDVFLSKINQNGKYKYRLPTTAEWEFTARGGIMDVTSKYPGSNNLDELAWYHKNSNDSTHEVGLKKPNELGLYDLAGNVMEFCKDIDGGMSIDGKAIKGGAYLSDTTSCKASPTYYSIPRDLPVAENNKYTGFRLLMELNEKKKQN